MRPITIINSVFLGIKNSIISIWDLKHYKLVQDYTSVIHY